MPEPVVVSWSGGKDSTLALAAVLADPDLTPVALLTTETAVYRRVTMHGVRMDLVEAQAAALGVPLAPVALPQRPSNDEYGRIMSAVMTGYREQGIERCVFGDLFLEDVRRYREENLAQLGMRGHFPLWGTPTASFARDVIDAGYRAIVVSVDPSQISPGFCGRDYDAAFLADLPPTADPAGENGEFHTFVWDGPIFARPVPVARGEVVEREGFWYCDLVPAATVRR